MWKEECALKNVHLTEAFPKSLCSQRGTRGQGVLWRRSALHARFLQALLSPCSLTPYLAALDRQMVAEGAGAPEPADHPMMPGVLTFLCTPSTQPRTPENSFELWDAQVIRSVCWGFPQSVSNNITLGRGSVKTTTIATKCVSLIKISFGNWWCILTY